MRCEFHLFGLLFLFNGTRVPWKELDKRRRVLWRKKESKNKHVWCNGCIEVHFRPEHEAAVRRWRIQTK